MNNHYDHLEIRDPAQRQHELIRAVAAQVDHAQRNAPAYTDLLKGVDPRDLDSSEAISKLPLTRKSELIGMQRRAPPFGGLSTLDSGSLAYIFASPGPIYEPGSRRGDFWHFARALFAAGFRAGDCIHNCFSYHLTPAGAMVDSGAHALGCSIIPAGVGQTELQVQTITDLRPSGYVGTPSFLKIILEKGDELGADLSCLSKGLVSGEALPASLRRDFSDRGIALLQCYATADLGVVAYESSADTGLIVEEQVYLEIVRPGTGEPVADGEVGEVVVTSLNPDYPLIRFATGDLSMVIPGSSACGRTNRRIKGWLGRADQTAKVRGMFVHPSQIDQILKRHPELDRARLLIEWIEQSDRMTLVCETTQTDDALVSAVAQTVRDICKLRAEVRLVTPGSLANDGKVIDDIRSYDT